MVAAESTALFQMSYSLESTVTMSIVLSIGDITPAYLNFHQFLYTWSTFFRNDFSTVKYELVRNIQSIMSL